MCRRLLQDRMSVDSFGTDPLPSPHEDSDGGPIAIVQVSFLFFWSLLDHHIPRTHAGSLAAGKKRSGGALGRRRQPPVRRAATRGGDRTLVATVARRPVFDADERGIPDVRLSTPPPEPQESHSQEPATATPEGEAESTSRSLVRVSETYSGPLPHPAILQQYEAIQPGFAERLLRMAEREQDHQHEMEKASAEAAATSERRGTWSALIVALCALSLPVI